MTSAATRVVLDTNVVASALMFRGPNGTAIRRAWTAGRIVPLVCRETVLELIRVLAYPKFDLSTEEQEGLLADYLPACEVVEVGSLQRNDPACRDPDDQVFVELAIVGRADCIVSGDKALLDLNGVAGLNVLGLSEFVRKYL